MSGGSLERCASNGIEVAYRRRGTGPSIVLLHGLTGSSAGWTPVARVLEASFEVVRPDARGHGDSSAPATGYGYDDLARDVEGLIEGLTLSRPILVGHSMGGMTAALVASRSAARLRGVVLVDPTFLEPARQREVHQSDVADAHRRAIQSPASALIAEARARHPRRSTALLEDLAEARLKTSPQAFDVLIPPNPDFRAVVKAIDVPVLLVFGDTQPVVTRTIAVELQRLNPRLAFCEVPDAGHGLPYDQPERLAELVAFFARSLPD